MKFIKWMFYAITFSVIYLFIAALVYGGNQTESTFHGIVIFYFVFLFIPLFLPSMKPSEIISGIKEGVKQAVKDSKKPVSKGWKITGLIFGIFDIVVIGFFAFCFFNQRDFPNQQEFYDLHKDEKYISSEYTYKGETESATWEIEFEKGEIKYVYYAEYGTLTRHIDWKVKEVSTKPNWSFVGEFFKKQQLVYKDPFKDKWITLDVIYEEKTDTILRLEGSGFVFMPEGK